MRDGIEIDGVATLKRLTLEACDAGFERAWGEQWLAPGSGSISAWLVSVWHGICDRRDREKKARALFTRVRRAWPPSAALVTEIREFLGGDYANGGGAATVALAVISDGAERGTLPPKLEGLSWWEDHCAKRGLAPAMDGLAAVVHAVLAEWRRDPIWREEPPTNREIAEFAILVGAAPAGWNGYRRKLEDDEDDRPVTPARVIEDVESRVRAIRSSI